MRISLIKKIHITLMLDNNFKILFGLLLLATNNGAASDQKIIRCSTQKRILTHYATINSTIVAIMGNTTVNDAVVDDFCDNVFSGRKINFPSLYVLRRYKLLDRNGNVRPKIRQTILEFPRE